MSDGISGLDGVLHNIGQLGRDIEEAAQKSLNHTSLFVERRAKEYLKAKVYSAPVSASGYKRTGTLRRSVHADVPSASHTNDEEEAKTSELSGKAEQDHAAEEVEKGLYLSQTGTWINYGPFVEKHKPFLQPAAEDGEEFFLSAAEREMRRIL